MLQSTKQQTPSFIEDENNHRAQSENAQNTKTASGETIETNFKPFLVAENSDKVDEYRPCIATVPSHTESEGILATDLLISYNTYANKYSINAVAFGYNQSKSTSELTYEMVGKRIANSSNYGNPHVVAMSGGNGFLFAYRENMNGKYSVKLKALCYDTINKNYLMVCFIFGVQLIYCFNLYLFSVTLKSVS